MSNSSFCHHLIKLCLLQKCEEASIGWKGLTEHSFVSISPEADISCQHQMWKKEKLPRNIFAMEWSARLLKL